MTIPTPRRSQHRHKRAVLAAALGALVALSGCGWGGSPDDDDAPAPQQTLDGTLKDVGPFQMLIPGEETGWSVLPTLAGVTEVQVGQCDEGTPCPSFSVIVGAALPPEFDGTEAWLTEESLCPGGSGFKAVNAVSEQVSEASIGGKDATLTQFALQCEDADGEARDMGAVQRQWYATSTPVGKLLVVDRWAIDTVNTRLTEAVWP